MSLAERPILNITGDKVALGPHRRELVPLYQRWLNDFEVTRTLSGNPGPMTREGEEEWYDAAWRKRNAVFFLIYERKGLRPIGSVGLEEINHRHRTSNFGILIGEKECWGRGYGTETASLMLEYGFRVLELENIMLTVYSYNERGIRAYTRAGFREFGRRRQALRLDGRAWDVIYMECLGSEFESSGRILPGRPAPAGD